MPRAALLALAVSLIGCRTAADEGPIDAPSDAVTKTADGGLSKKLGVGPTLASKPRLANTLVAVASTTPSEAQPCERVCGSLGDCLFASDNYTALIAGGLELECIDRCVHSADTEPAKTDLLACGAKTECGQLEACIERTWTALGGARQAPGVVGISSADPCKAGCRWMFSCFITNAPPGEAYLEPQYEQMMNECVDGCDHMPVDQREMMIHYGTCLPDNCTLERLDVCTGYVRY